MNTKQLLLSLFAILALSACASIRYPDMKVYAVPGAIIAGANWSYTGHDETGEISFKELIELLEGGALIVSSEDYKRNKIASEQACYKLGAACGFEVRKTIADTDRRINKILEK